LGGTCLLAGATQDGVYDGNTAVAIPQTTFRLAANTM
jgi:hypothetical protein